MTYTYDDIVTAKDILTGKVKKEDIIGKRGWFLDVIPYDMSLDEIKNLGVSGHLEDLHLIDNGSPFGNGYQPFAYFLPEKEQSYEERQAEWVKENDIKLGDKVRILRKFNDFENGCDVGMNKDGKMDSLVGTVGKVSAIDDESIEVDSEGDCWFWPYFVLEKVEDEYVPFDLSDSKDRDFLRGKWVKTKQPESESQISSFKYTDGYGWRAHIPNVGHRTGEDILEELTFLDGSVIGKPANGQQMK